MQPSYFWRDLMKLSTRCRYGTRAMLEIARQYGIKPVKRNDISRSQGIPSAYLENILIILKTQNLIQTIRGANGGFILGKSPRDISMYQIMIALEGSIAPVHCIGQISDCEKSGHCTAQKFWLHLYEVQVRTLMDTSLQTLLDLESSDLSIDYCI